VEAGRRFDEGYRQWRSSAAHASLLGQGLPPEIEPFSFVPLEGMELLAILLGLDAGQTLVDLGCGRGGPGMWLAQHSAANVVGVDASVVAVGDALARRHAFPWLASACFQAADVMATGLVDGSADAVVSIDVLQLLDDPAGLLGEAARLLRPTGPLVLTTWEGHGAAPGRFPRNLAGLIESVGLDVATVIEQPSWLDRQLDIYIAAGAADTSSAGDLALSDLAEEGRRWQGWHDQTRRVVAVARLPGTAER